MNNLNQHSQIEVLEKVSVGEYSTLSVLRDTTNNVMYLLHTSSGFITPMLTPTGAPRIYSN